MLGMSELNQARRSRFVALGAPVAGVSGDASVVGVAAAAGLEFLPRYCFVPSTMDSV